MVVKQSDTICVFISVDKDGQRRYGQGSTQEDGAGRPGWRHRPHHDSVPAADEAQQAGLRSAALRETLGAGAAGFFTSQGWTFLDKVDGKDNCDHRVVLGAPLFSELSVWWTIFELAYKNFFRPEAGGKLSGQLKWNFYAAVKAKRQISFIST